MKKEIYTVLIATIIAFLVIMFAVGVVAGSFAWIAGITCESPLAY